MFDTPTMPELETDRLHLRALMPADADAFAQHLSDPDVIRYLLDIDEPLTTPAAARPFMDWARMLFARREGIGWGIARKSDGVLMGSLGFGIWHARYQYAEVGYFLGKPYWGQGYISEALRAAIPFGFEQGMARLEATVVDGNMASVRVLQKLGFQIDGRLRKKIPVDGVRRDLLFLGLLREEF